jgi:hypothetical protein
MPTQPKTNNQHQPFFGAMGCTSAIVFTCFGAAYGTAKSGVGIAAMGVLRPDLIVKSPFCPRTIPARRPLTTRKTLSLLLWRVSLVSTAWSCPF